MGASRMTRRSSWAKRWAKHWANHWGLVDETSAAGNVSKKHRRPYRTGAPWHWVPPPQRPRRNRKKRDAELLAILHP